MKYCPYCGAEFLSGAFLFAHPAGSPCWCWRSQPLKNLRESPRLRGRGKRERTRKRERPAQETEATRPSRSGKFGLRRLLRGRPTHRRGPPARGSGYPLDLRMASAGGWGGPGHWRVCAALFFAVKVANSLPHPCNAGRISSRGSTEYEIYRKGHCGRGLYRAHLEDPTGRYEFQLTGDRARLWINGRFGVSDADGTNPWYVKELLHLKAGRAGRASRRGTGGRVPGPDPVRPGTGQGGQDPSTLDSAGKARLSSGCGKQGCA